MINVNAEAIREIVSHASSSDETAGGSNSLDYAADLMDEHEFTDEERAAVYCLAEGLAGQ